MASYLRLVQLGERQTPVPVDYWGTTDEACATERDTNFKSLNHRFDSAMIQKSTSTLLAKNQELKPHGSYCEVNTGATITSPNIVRIQYKPVQSSPG